MAASATVTSHQNLRDSATVTISSGGSLSGAANLAGKTLVGIVMPAAWDAANLTFQGSQDGVSFANLYGDDGTERTVTAAASRFIALNPASWIALNFLKVRSGTSGSAVNQTADRDVILVCVP